MSPIITAIATAPVAPEGAGDAGRPQQPGSRPELASTRVVSLEAWEHE